MKYQVIVCKGCGQRNRLPTDAWRADCGRCEDRLSVPGSFEKMMKANTHRIISAVGGVAMLGLFISGVIEMLPGNQAEAEPTVASDSLDFE